MVIEFDIQILHKNVEILHKPDSANFKFIEDYCDRRMYLKPQKKPIQFKPN